MNFEADLFCARERLFRDALRAPVDIFKHAAVQLLQPDQVVATVIRWAENNSVAGLR